MVESRADARERDLTQRHMSAVDALDTRLTEGILRLNKDLEAELKRHETQITHLLDTVPGKLHEQSDNLEGKHRDTIATLRKEMECFVAEVSSQLARCSLDNDVKHQELAQLSCQNEALIEQQVVKCQGAVDTLEWKISDLFLRNSSEEEQKHEAHRLAIQGAVDEVLAKLRHEIGRVQDVHDVRATELRDHLLAENSRTREELSRVAQDQERRMDELRKMERELNERSWREKPSSSASTADSSPSVGTPGPRIRLGTHSPKSSHRSPI